MSLRQCQRYIIFSTVRLILTLDLFLMSCLNVNIVRQELIKMFHIPWSHMFDWDRNKVINLLYTFPESWAFLINVFRNELQCNRIPACSHKKNVLLCCDLLPPIWLVCCCLLDKVWFTNVLCFISLWTIFFCFWASWPNTQDTNNSIIVWYQFNIHNFFSNPSRGPWYYKMLFFSFLVNPEIIPGRMTLLVTIFLVLINIHNTIQTNSPKVSPGVGPD